MGRENPKLVAIQGGFQSCREESSNHHSLRGGRGEATGRRGRIKPETIEESTSNENAALKRPQKRLRTTMDLQEELQKQLAEEHKWKEEQHHRRIKILKLQEELYERLVTDDHRPPPDAESPSSALISSIYQNL